MVSGVRIVGEVARVAAQMVAHAGGFVQSAGSGSVALGLVAYFLNKLTRRLGEHVHDAGAVGGSREGFLVSGGKNA